MTSVIFLWWVEYALAPYAEISLFPFYFSRRINPFTIALGIPDRAEGFPVDDNDNNNNNINYV